MSATLGMSSMPTYPEVSPSLGSSGLTTGEGAKGSIVALTLVASRWFLIDSK
jgi:hypothetical protein